MAVRKLRKQEQEEKVNYSITLPRMLVEEVAHIRGGTKCIVTWIPMGAEAPTPIGGHFAIYTLGDHIHDLVMRLDRGDTGVIDELLQYGDPAVDPILEILESSMSYETTSNILTALIKINDVRVVDPIRYNILSRSKQHPRQCPICGRMFERTGRQSLSREEAEDIILLDDDFGVWDNTIHIIDDYRGLFMCADCFDAGNIDLIKLLGSV